MYTISRERIYFSRPPPEYLPSLPNSCLEYLFRALPVHHIVSIWSVVMIEKKVLLISQHKALLTYVAMALTSLVFPFRWEQVLIPILPSPLKNYIETIFPYIIGVSPSMITPDIEVPIDAVKVDLDSGIILYQEPLPKLPDKLQRALLAKLKTYANIYRSQDAVRETVDDAFNSIMKDDEEFKQLFHPYRVRDAFLEFQTSLLKHYQRYLMFSERTSTRFGDFRSTFNVQMFLSYHKARTQDNFLYKVTETSMFANFIESRSNTETSNLDLNYFDVGMKFNRTKNDPSFVKFYAPQETLPALQANDIGFEPGTVFRYDRFPRLNDQLFIEPRIVKKLAVNAAPKPTLLLKDDVLLRMKQGEWAKFLLTTIYRIWFYMFSVNMPKYKSHANDLMNMGFSVLDLMKKQANKPDEEIYRKLIKACGHCALNDTVHLLFKKMKNQGIEPDPITHGVYVKATAEQATIEERVQQSMNLKDLRPESLCLSLELSQCVFIVEDSCPKCSDLMMFENIISGWERSYSYYTTKCPQQLCETKFIARFSVIMDKGALSEDRNSTIVDFLSPPLLRKELENLVYSYGESALLAKDLCDTHRILYWNMVLYFDLLKLPTFFINPNFDVRILPRVIEEYRKPVKQRVRAPQRNTQAFAANSADEASDNSSISGKSSTSNISFTGGDYKLMEFVRRGRGGGSKSSATSENQSTKTSTKNLSLMKVFAPYIEDFRADNFQKGQSSLAKQGLDIDHAE